MSRTSWKSIQRQLKKLGHDPGPIDGVQGAKTINAVKAFQRAAGLLPDGIVGRKTRGVMFENAQKIDYSIMTCAQLAAISYKLKQNSKGTADTTLGDDFGLTVKRRCPTPGVEAYMLSNGCLLIPGSNSFADYIRFNLRIIRLGAKQLKLTYKQGDNEVFSEDAKAGASRTIWHQGFLAHATIIYDWIGKDQSNWPNLVIGHSLGAASAQILSKTFVTPAIGFAAPKLRKVNGRINHDHLSLSICRDDDVVCTLPGGFHHTGQIKKLIHKKRKRGLNHNMKAYIDALENQAPGLNIPTVWDP